MPQALQHVIEAAALVSAFTSGYIGMWNLFYRDEHAIAAAYFGFASWISLSVIIAQFV